MEDLFINLKWERVVQKIELFVLDFFLKKKFIIEEKLKITDSIPEDQIGDVSIILFSLLNKNSSFDVQELIFELKQEFNFIDSCFFIKGFLNLSFKESFLVSFLENFHFKFFEEKKKIVVEFCSPNTNKPLHLGHLRNIFIGQFSVNILKFFGHEVFSTCVINDKGIHICKSMLSFMISDCEDSPSISKIKGDKFVGNYYVKFDSLYKEELKNLKDNQDSILMKKANEILEKWENNDEKIVSLWKKMNCWVYEGFEETFDKLNLKFDKIYYESDIYNLGKKIVENGVKDGIFYKKENNSIAISISEEPFCEKIIIRSNGTSVYITQDIALSFLKKKDFNFDKSIYIVGNEQDYHFDVLFKILNKIDQYFIGKLFHYSYGMVELPSGKMKSREGNIVDVDDIIDEMFFFVKDFSEKLDKKFDIEDKVSLYKDLSIGAIKYFFLKVDFKKKIVFDKEESISLDGNSSIFLQYTKARISSLLDKFEKKVKNFENVFFDINLDLEETKLIRSIIKFYKYIQESYEKLSSNCLCNGLYHLSKIYNKFYSNCKILSLEDENRKKFRLYLSYIVGEYITLGLNILGIKSPDRM